MKTFYYRMKQVDFLHTISGNHNYIKIVRFRDCNIDKTQFII